MIYFVKNVKCVNVKCQKNMCVLVANKTARASGEGRAMVDKVCGMNCDASEIERIRLR